MAETVLLVEDNDENREIYSTMLSHYGFDVTHAVAGDEALRIARDLLPSVILLDISIPRIDGWEVARQLRADRTTRDSIIIALTAHALPADHQKAREVGCDSYLAKPVRPRRVLEEIRDLLERRADAPAESEPSADR